MRLVVEWFFQQKLASSKASELHMIVLYKFPLLGFTYRHCTAGFCVCKRVRKTDRNLQMTITITGNFWISTGGPIGPPSAVFIESMGIESLTWWREQSPMLLKHLCLGRKTR